MNNDQHKIIAEIAKSYLLFGAKADLLSYLGSWGNTISDEMVYNGLKSFNDKLKKEYTDRLHLANDPS